MSMDRCVNCDAFVDTDDDPGCYVECPSYHNTAMPVKPTGERVEWDCICEFCRDQMIDDEECNDATAA